MPGTQSIMEPLILHPTPIAQWQALIFEAEEALHIKLSEELESYLVFLLMRFAKNPEVVQSILATEFLRGLEQIKRERNTTLREVGDKCLLFAGLFPGRARHVRVPISYFIKLGQTAYGSLSESKPMIKKNLASEYQNESIISNIAIYDKLRFHFVGLMDILHTIHETHSDTAFLDLLQAEELWHETHSQHALKIIKENFKGNSKEFILSSLLPRSHKKH